jgi:hypothetical protein
MSSFCQYPISNRASLLSGNPLPSSASPVCSSVDSCSGDDDTTLHRWSETHKQKREAIGEKPVPVTICSAAEIPHGLDGARPGRAAGGKPPRVSEWPIRENVKSRSRFLPRTWHESLFSAVSARITVAAVFKATKNKRVFVAVLILPVSMFPQGVMMVREMRQDGNSTFFRNVGNSISDEAKSHHRRTKY